MGMKSDERHKPTSPPWQPGTRLVAGVFLIILAILLLYLIRSLLASLFLALLLAYLLHPLIIKLTTKWRLPRGVAVLLVFLGLILILIAMMTGLGLTISQRASQLASYLGDLSETLPAQIETIGELQITIGPWDIDLSQVNLEPILSDLASLVSPFLSQTGNLLASVAKTTASVVALVVLALVLGYYLLLDFSALDTAMMTIVPYPYRGDFRSLMDETGRIWHAFIRGQAILAVVMALLVWLILTILRVRFPVMLALISGLMEFVPWLGPIIAGVVTIMVALFQGGNIWGLSPLAFALVVLIVFTIIQQFENNVLYPGIIGHSLKLHPLIVILSVLAGGILAGLIGFLLAAPTVATLRVWLGYVYRKSVGLDTRLTPMISSSPGFKAPEIVRHLPERIRVWRARLRRDDAEGEK
jgi:predicted PurR-regulated permease PerM